MSRFLIAFVVSLVSLLHGCHQPTISYFETKYPGCRVMKIENLPDDYVQAKMRCGVSIKVVQVRESTRRAQ